MHAKAKGNLIYLWIHYIRMLYNCKYLDSDNFCKFGFEMKPDVTEV